MVDRIPLLLCVVLAGCGDLGASAPPPPPVTASAAPTAAPAPIVAAPVPMVRAPQPVTAEEELLLAIPGGAGGPGGTPPGEGHPGAGGAPGGPGAAPATRGAGSSFTAAGGAADSAWCCQYDGPLGKTQDLIDNPAACATKYADHAPEFVTSPACVAVCCEYARDPADLSKGMVFSEVAAGNCDMRRGRIVELDDGASCRDPARPAPRRPAPVRPAPAPAPPPPPKYDPFRPKQR